MNSVISKIRKILMLTLLCCSTILLSNNIVVFAEDELPSWTWDVNSKTLTLNNMEISDSSIFKDVVSEDGTFPDRTKLILNGDSSIAGGENNAITCAGNLTIEGSGELTLTGKNGISATSITIKDINLDINSTIDGIYIYNTAGDATVTLQNVTGSIVGGARAGIYVNGEYTESKAYVIINNCNLDIISQAPGYNGRAQKSAVTVYIEKAEKVESSIKITDSKVNATGADAGLCINNYVKGANAMNSASSYIDITNSLVTAKGTNGTWSGIFASVLGEHTDADSIITIKDSSVYVVSPNTGVLTSSQSGESRIILDNSILGASGKTAISMIEEGAQVKEATLKNGSTYVQMTPAAIMKGTLDVVDGKTIIATAGDGITYDMDNNYYIIPQGSEVKEVFINAGTVRYTFNNQAGGIGGFSYEKEEIWGYDKDYICEIVETGIQYKTLKEAVEDANSLSGANTMRLLNDIDFKVNTNAVLTVSEDLTIIGDYTISRGGYTGNLFKVPVGVKLTLSDGVTFDGSNNWALDEELFEYNLVNRIRASSVNDYIIPQDGGTVATAAMFNVLGTLEMNDVVMQNNYTTKSNSGIAYLSGADAILITNGTEFKDCASTGSSTIVSLNKNSKWYINDDTNIHDNFVGGNGGICYISSSNVYMSGGIITHTRGYNSNGTVFMMYGGNATLNMTGGTICENYGTKGPQNGRNAAVYLHSTGILNMTGGSICHNIGNIRGGIDSYKSNSTLNINRVDQEFIDGKPVNESGPAAYNELSHPYIGDNVSLMGEAQYDVGYNVDQTAHWWVTGGIYTQDVDEFCSEGYVCIPYDITARTDDYIVVPGYRVRYFSVEKDITTDTDGNEITNYKKTLEDKYIHMLPKDKFWYEMDEHAEYIEVINEKHENIDTWYTEQELVNMYDFENTKLTDNLDLYGEYENHVHTEVKIEAVINGDASHTKKFNYKSEYTDVYNYFDENGNSTNYNFTLDINTSTKIELVALGSELIITETKPAEYTLDIDVTYLDENGNRVSSDYTLIDNGVKVKVNKGLEIKFIHKKAEMTTNKFVTGSSTDDLVINLETYVNGDTLAVEQTRPADVVLVIDQSGSMIRPIVDKEKLTRTDLATDQAKENGTHGLYYLAYGSSTVNYLVFKDGEWYRYETNRSKTSGWDNYIPNMDVIRNNSVLMDDAKWTEFEQYGIWQTRYGATYDALKAFINTLKDEGIDHRVAFVGFGSASDGITNLIVDGVKTKYNSLTNDICADAFRSILTDTDSLMSSLEAIHCNSKYTNAGAGLSIARKIYDNNSADSSRDRMVILFSDGADAKGTDPYGNSYALKNTYGAKIYSIKAASATATFLDHMSSNYPEATSASAVGTKYSNKYFLTTSNADDLIAVFSSLVSEVSSSGTKLNTYTVIRDTMSEYFELPAGINASNVKEYIKVYTADYMADGTFSNNLADITNDDNIIITIKTHNGKDVVEVTGFDFADNFIAITNGVAQGKKLVVQIPIKQTNTDITGDQIITNDSSYSGVYNEGVLVKPFESPSVDMPVSLNVIKIIEEPDVDKCDIIIGYTVQDGYELLLNNLHSVEKDITSEISLKNNESELIQNIIVGSKIKITDNTLNKIEVYTVKNGVRTEFKDFTVNNGIVEFTILQNMEIILIDEISFKLDAYIIRILGDNKPIFRAGEAGYVVINTIGDITNIKVDFPDELTQYNTDLDNIIEVNNKGKFTHRYKFTVPLQAEVKIYKVSITAHNTKGETLTVIRDLQVVDERVVDDFKTIIR